MKVKCIKNENLGDHRGTLTLGELYEVERSDQSDYFLENDQGDTHSFAKWRFEEVPCVLFECINNKNCEWFLTQGKIYEAVEVGEFTFLTKDDEGENFNIHRYNETRFKKVGAIKELEKNTKMKIGDTVTCVDAWNSENLVCNDEYVIVDINQHGNIGVKHPASNTLCPHYYKPSRFVIPTPKPLEVNLWVNKNTNKVHMPLGDPQISYLKEGTVCDDFVVKLFREVQ